EAQTQGKRAKINAEPAVHSRATPDSNGPRELFAVVDMEGNLRRGMHATASKRLDVGVYEGLFNRDVRRGGYLASIGGPGYEGSPPAAIAARTGPATGPRRGPGSTSRVVGGPRGSGVP